MGSLISYFIFRSASRHHSRSSIEAHQPFHAYNRRAGKVAGESKCLRVLLDEFDTLGDILLQVFQCGGHESFLVLVDLADRVDGLHTFGSKLNLAGEESDSLVLVERAFDEGWLDDTLFSLSSLEQTLGETCTGHRHREGGRSCTVFGLDDLVTPELDTVDDLIELGAGDIRVCGLREEWHDGDARVTSDDGHVLVSGIGITELRDEARGADDIKGGHSEESLGVVDTLRLEDLSDDWYC